MNRISVVIRPLFLVLIASTALAGSVWAASPTASVTSSLTSGCAGPASQSKSSLVQDPSWIAAKNSGRVHRNAQGIPTVLTVQPLLTYPSHFTLATTPSQVAEPYGSGYYDDHHHSYRDDNYWRFCGPGSATVTAYYWSNVNVLGWPAGNFTEPNGTHQTKTYWAASDTGGSIDTSEGFATIGRSYLMYMAEQVNPPNFLVPGIVTFNAYPTTAGASMPDTRDGLNWEISGHNQSLWQNYYYVWQPNSGSRFTAANLLTDVEYCVYYDGTSVLVAVDTAYLPNWGISLAHAITIIGYDNVAGTYTYIDTCASRCRTGGGSQNTGTYTATQTAMWHALSSTGLKSGQFGYLH